MTQSTHGLVQSEVLAHAAQNLSGARINYDRVRELYPQDFDTIEAYGSSLTYAQEMYDIAYKQYTNPFGVEKTVDARWPNVPK